MKRILLIFFGLQLCINLSADTFRGTVTDKKDNPVSGVSITILSEQIFVTGPDGRFEFSLKEQQLPVSAIFYTAGFVPETLTLFKTIPQPVRIVLMPLKSLKEEISVTPFDLEVKKGDIPLTEQTITSLDLTENIPENVAAQLAESPSVDVIGQGGYSVTPSIRGLARRRVLSLIEGVRIVSDRRVGSSPSFFHTEMIHRIDIVKSASSVVYGSDAMGGVINILTKQNQPESFSGELHMTADADRFSGGLNYYSRFGQWNMYSGFHATEASDYSSPEGKIHHSGYSLFSGKVGLEKITDKRDLSIMLLTGTGLDIGKPDRDNNPDTYSGVLSDQNHILLFKLTDRSLFEQTSIKLDATLNPTIYELEKINYLTGKTEYSKTDSLNLSIKLSAVKTIYSNITLHTGIDIFARRNLDITNRTEENNILFSDTPLKNGSRTDTGLFATLKWNGTASSIISGVRYSFFSLNATSGGVSESRKDRSPSYFLGATKYVTNGLSVFGNISRAFRIPSLGELFYTGLSGRRYIIGNKALNPEKSTGTDLGIRWESSVLSLSAAVFRNSIKNMIERYPIEEGIYTYDNVEKGTIQGLEIQGQARLGNHFLLAVSGSRMRGESDITGEPLNDIPSQKLRASLRFYGSKGFIKVKGEYVSSKNNPGPSEIDNSCYTIIDLLSGYTFSSRKTVMLKIENMTDESYFPNADPDIPMARGLNISTHLIYRF